MSESDQAAGIQLFRTDATVVLITVAVDGVATHPEDDLVQATAVSGQVDYLVTLDRQLLRLCTFVGVRIVTTREFLTILQAEEEG
jgi:predicted nucleic acid-binding protein